VRKMDSRDGAEVPSFTMERVVDHPWPCERAPPFWRKLPVAHELTHWLGLAGDTYVATQATGLYG
jgi:hypothetical protein